MNTTVFSGHRLKFLKPEVYRYQWEALRRNMQQFEKLFALAMSEPYFVDDCWKAIPPLDFLMDGLRNGELFICMDGDNLAGFMGLTDIVHERSATFDAWSNPAYRQGYRNQKLIKAFAEELIEYAFKPFGPIAEGGGLGLKKLKAEVAFWNRPAWGACKRLGFTEVGMSLLDGLYNSIPVDIVYLELLNREYFGPMNEGQLHGTQGIEPTAGLLSDVPTTTSLHTAAGTRDGSTARDDSDSIDSTGECSGVTDTEVAPIHKPKPYGPRRQKPIRK